MPSLRVNNITISFDDEGEGGSLPLLLVHGHPFDRSMWRPQIRSLSRSRRRVIAPDLRGYGESSVVPGKTTLDVFARDLEALLDVCRVDGRVVIGGLSMGGQIVMECCRLFPERIAAIVLAATFPQSETAEGKRNRNAAADQLLREGMDAYAEEALPRMLAAHTIATLPAVAAHVLAMMQGAHPDGSAAALRGRAERPSYADVLAGLDIPALIVAGAEDTFTTREDAERMHGLLKSSELVWMEGVGHMPNLERESEFNAALEGFLAALDAAA